MAVDDLGAAESREQPDVERIGALAPHVPGIAKHAHVERSHASRGDSRSPNVTSVVGTRAAMWRASSNA